MRLVSLGLLFLAAACGASTASLTDAAPAGEDARVVDARVLDARVLDAAPPRDGGSTAGVPAPGAHAIAFHTLHLGQAPIHTPAMNTAASGSTIVVSAGRGALAEHVPPTDNKGNGPYVQLDTAHAYTRWGSSGTATYAFTGAVGGAGHVVTAATPPGDEITLAAVEVKNASTIRQVTWVERLAAPLTSAAVTTTGPAVLVAFWWGDADVNGDKTAVPNNGFQVVDSVLAAGALVQCAVAVRQVNAAGTYDVTWTSTPAQGAQLWLIAVE